MATASGYEVVLSTNSLRLARVPGAMDRIGELAADGAWFIPGNSDLRPDQWRPLLARLHGTHYTEDVLKHPDGSDATGTRDFYRQASEGKSPAMAMVYNEHPGEGNTVLDPDEIEEAFRRYGNRPLVVLTRAYVGPWQTEVDRALRNPKVGGVCIEPTRGAILEEHGPGIHNGVPSGIQAVLRAGKKVFLLMHTGADTATDPWDDSHHVGVLKQLEKWLTVEEMRSRNLVLVYQFYDIDKRFEGTGTTEKWFGEHDSVRSAIRIAKSHRHYTGNRPNVIRKATHPDYALDGSNGGANGQNIHLWTVQEGNLNQSWEEVDLGDGWFAYLKAETKYAIDGDQGAADGQNIHLWDFDPSNLNQHWFKVDLGSGQYRLLKRGADDFAVDGGSDAANGQNVRLGRRSDADQDQRWLIDSRD